MQTAAIAFLLFTTLFSSLLAVRESIQEGNISRLNAFGVSLAWAVFFAVCVV